MEKNRRNESIDALRGIGVLMVILVHTAQKYHLPIPLNYICAYGQYACQLFFVISGYFAWKSIVNNDAVKYYKKRIRAMYPGWWTTVFFFYAFNSCWQRIGLRVQTQWNHSLGGIIINLLGFHGLVLTCNNNVVPGGWYVGTTIILYALTPAFKRWIIQSRYIYASPVILCIASIVIQLIVSMIVGDMGLSENNQFLYFSFINQAVPYLMGMVLGKMELLWLERMATQTKRLLIIGIMVLLMSFSLSIYERLPVPMLMPFIVGLGWSCLLLHTLYRNQQHEEYWVSKKLGDFGKLSYSAYLIHSVFAYNMTYVINKICSRVNISNSLFLFVPSLLIVVICVYHFSKIYNYVIQKTAVCLDGIIEKVG